MVTRSEQGLRPVERADMTLMGMSRNVKGGRSSREKEGVVKPWGTVYG